MTAGATLTISFENTVSCLLKRSKTKDALLLSRFMTSFDVKHFDLGSGLLGNTLLLFYVVPQK